MKLVCEKCQRDMRIEDIGIVVMDVAYSPPSPYKYYNTDKYVCPECGVSILINPSSTNGKHIGEEESKELRHHLGIGGEIVIVWENKFQKFVGKSAEQLLKEQHINDT
jgi:DNA-directed RNA polymerase subunit RPC12/RpoP